MSLGTILLIVLVLMLVGALPNWGHSRSWGYGPSGGLGRAAHRAGSGGVGADLKIRRNSSPTLRTPINPMILSEW